MKRRFANAIFAKGVNTKFSFDCKRVLICEETLWTFTWPITQVDERTEREQIHSKVVSFMSLKHTNVTWKFWQHVLCTICSGETVQRHSRRVDIHESKTVKRCKETEVSLELIRVFLLFDVIHVAADVTFILKWVWLILTSCSHISDLIFISNQMQLSN